MVKAERTGRYVEADVVAMSHDHEVHVALQTRLRPDPRSHIDPKTGFRRGKTRALETLLVKTNAHLKWGGYGRAKGHAPVSLRTPIVILNGEGPREVHLFI